MKAKKKTCILLVTVCLLIGCAIGGTLAWLTAKTDEVKNTFTTSDINITLEETTGTDYKMVPGWTIDKNPVVTVKAGSEDCWLFVEVTESTEPKLADYIAYSVNISEDAWTQGEGTGEGKNGVPTNVYFRKVTGVANDTEYNVLGAGSKVVDEVTYSWSANQVLVLPTVTKAMMEALNQNGATKPTLTFEAYAVQLHNTNSTEFTAAQAWGQAVALKTTP